MQDNVVIQSGPIVNNADQVLTETAILDGPYFASLQSGEMSRESFCQSQRQFYFAVDYFSRPMSALLMRLPSARQRLGILANVLEEHGEFQPAAFHEATFREFLQSVGDDQGPDPVTIEPPVHAFNAAIMSACLVDEIQVGIACLGIIEYAFADISALIGNMVVKRGWVTQAALTHYSLHAEIDKKHAADFFELLREDWKTPQGQALIKRGLRLGGYVFDRLYRDLIAVDGASPRPCHTSESLQ